MAHYLLKKRVMMELQQQQQQQQQEQLQQQQQKQKDTKDNGSIDNRLRDTDKYCDNYDCHPAEQHPASEWSVTDISRQKSNNYNQCGVTEAGEWSDSGGVLDLSKKPCNQTPQHSTDFPTDLTLKVEEKSDLPLPSHGQNYGDAPSCSTPKLYRADTCPQRTVTELESLNEKEEKQRLISKIVSIVRETVKVPIHSIDLSEKSVLQCMNILSNPFCELNNCSMMQMQNCNPQQAGTLNMPGGTNDMNNQLSKPLPSEGFGPLISEGALWPVRNPDIAQLAVARPTPGKQLHDAMTASNSAVPGLSSPRHQHQHQDTGTYCMDTYLPSMQSSSPPSSSASSGFLSNPGSVPHLLRRESIEQELKAECTKSPYIFGNHHGQVNELAREQRQREAPETSDATMVPVQLGSSNNQFTSSELHHKLNIQKTNGHIYGGKEHTTSSFMTRSPGGSGFDMPQSGKQESSKSESFPEQQVYAQLPSFHRGQEGQLSPVTGSHQNSPAAGPVCDSSSHDQEIFECFSRNEHNGTNYLPVTTSSAAAQSFQQPESCGIPECPLTSPSAVVTAGETLAAGTQQNVISSSSATASGSKTVTSLKRKHPAVDGSLSGYPVTSSGRNKGLGKTNEPKFDCQICGDLAAGFHCGAYVCEACKKFYLRCLKNDQNLLTCPKSQRCEINKDNRSHCQYCRYQKCISLGMYRPGREDDKNLKVNFKAIPCKVCGASSSGFHFGAITCEGCKGFFRRMLKENLHQKFTCSSGNSCDITSSNRTFCKACRFSKCLKIGMTLEGTRLGRQSNSMKRNTLMAYRMREFDGPPAKIVTPGKIKLEPVDDGYQGESNAYSRPSEGVKDADCSIVEDFDVVSLEVIDQLELDNNLLDVSDSASARTVSQKMAKNLRNVSGLKCGNRNTDLGDDAVISEPLTTQSSKFMGEPSGIPTASSHQSESLGVTWDGVFSVSENSNMLPASDSNEHYSEGKPSLTENHAQPHGSLTGTDQKANPNGLESYSKDADDHSNPVAPNKPGMQNSKPKQVGVEIYSDPERLTSYLVDIYDILDGMKEIPESMKQYKLEVGNPQNIWNFTMQGFVHNSYIMLRFLKSIPGFRSLPQDKQIKLCQETIYPISLLYHSQGYDLQQRKVKFFCYTDEVRELLFTSFPNFRGMMNHFEQCGRWMAEMKIDRIELAFLTVIFVLRATEQTIHDPAVRGYLETTTDILISYCDKKDTLRGGVLLARMAELERASFEHHQMAALTIKQNPHMSFGQLWQEIFIPD